MELGFGDLLDEFFAADPEGEMGDVFHTDMEKIDG